MDNTYTQRQWDREVGYGKVPEEYAMSSEDMMIKRVLLNELVRIEVLQNVQYTDQDIIVRELMQSRINDLTKYRE